MPPQMYLAPLKGKNQSAADGKSVYRPKKKTEMIIKLKNTIVK